MRIDSTRDTLRDLWEAIEPDQLNKDPIQEATLALKYLLDPGTHQIQYAISLDLESNRLRRIYKWASPAPSAIARQKETPARTWQSLLEGLAATVTGMILPEEKC